MLNDSEKKSKVPKQEGEIHQSPDKNERYIKQNCACLHEQLYPIEMISNPSLVTFTVLLRNIGRQILHNPNIIADLKTILPQAFAAILKNSVDLLMPALSTDEDKDYLSNLQKIWMELLQQNKMWEGGEDPGCQSWYAELKKVLAI